MGMVLFYSKFPELAVKETITVKIQDNAYNLPNKEYAFFESYCDETNCDCRRVLINVLEKSIENEIKAVISYGWENVEYYEKRIGHYESAVEATIPFLDPLFKQTEVAESLLLLFKNIILYDKKIINILKKHYEIFKNSMINHQNRKVELDIATKINRNDLCNCGSKKKYKKCCGKNA